MVFERVLSSLRVSPEPGWEARLAGVLGSGLDPLSRDALWTFAQEREGGAGSFLASLSHPRLGPALRVIHREPVSALPASRLARLAGLSRTLLFARFLDVTGESPSSYVCRWRVHLAASWLRSSNDRLDQVAASVGLFDGSALTKAFRRTIGLNPGAYRRLQRRGAGLLVGGCLPLPAPPAMSARP